MDNKRTFVMLKPDAVDGGLAYDVVSYFKKYGFTIETFGIVTADEEKVMVHYEEVIAKLGDEFAAKMKVYMVGKHVVPIVLYREEGDAVEIGRRMIGATDPSKAEPGTVRGDLGTDSYEKCNAENRTCHNLIHASDSVESFVREVGIWLPKYSV